MSNFIENISIMTDRNAEEMIEICVIKPEYLNNKRILNVGSGRTDLEKSLREKYDISAQVTNVDLAYDPNRKSWLWYLIGKTPKDAYPPNPVQADMTKLPFKDQSFDLTISTAVTDLWVKDKRRTASLKEMCRVTKQSVLVSPFDPINNRGYIESLLDIVPDFWVKHKDNLVLRLDRDPLLK